MSPADLASVLSSFPFKEVKNLLVGFDNPDDAAVYEIAPDVALVQTVDFFTPIVNDPYRFGLISAANSLSDVYAMGGTPKTAMNIVCFPGCLDMTVLEDILRGGRDVADKAGVVIVGGHTIEDDEPKYGMAVTGVVDRNRILTISGARPGDKIILTKPLGFGILATALKADLVTEDDISDAIENAATLNRNAAEIMLKYDVEACTDVTGFGLIGHLLGVMKSSGTSSTLYCEKIPMYSKALEYAAMGIIPEGAHKNRDYFAERCTIDTAVSLEHSDILFDPQTSGGLLIFAASEEADSLVEELRFNQEVPIAEIIGEVKYPNDTEIEIKNC